MDDPDDPAAVWLSNSPEILGLLAEPLRKGGSRGHRLSEAAVSALRAASGLPPRDPASVQSFPALPADGGEGAEAPPGRDDEDSEGEPDEPTESPERPPGEESITPSQQAELRKLHVNLGHPPQAEFLRTLRVAHAKDQVIRWARHHFRCSTCEGQQGQKGRRRAAIPRTYRFNKIVAVCSFSLSSQVKRYMTTNRS